MAFKDVLDYSHVVASRKFYFPVGNKSNYIHVFVHSTRESLLQFLDDDSSEGGDDTLGACVVPSWFIGVAGSAFGKVRLDGDEDKQAEIHLLEGQASVEVVAHEMCHFLVNYLVRNPILVLEMYTEDGLANSPNEVLSLLVGSLTSAIYDWAQNPD